MLRLSVLVLGLIGLLPVAAMGQIPAEDAALCLNTADRVTSGTKLEDPERMAAHEACLRALATTSNVVQKYHLQEADFDIMGTRPKSTP
jgi:hypothetical protein